MISLTFNGLLMSFKTSSTSSCWVPTQTSLDCAQLGWHGLVMFGRCHVVGTIRALLFVEGPEHAGVPDWPHLRWFSGSSNMQVPFSGLEDTSTKPQWLGGRSCHRLARSCKKAKQRWMQQFKRFAGDGKKKPKRCLQLAAFGGILM